MGVDRSRERRAMPSRPSANSRDGTRAFRQGSGQAGNRRVRAMASEAGGALQERQGAPSCGGKAKRCCASRKAASPTARTATATASSSPLCPMSIRRRGSATWRGPRSRWPAWGTAPRRAPRCSLISTRGRPAKCAREVNGADYQISVVRYFGDGAEEPFFTQEGSTNIEFDDWGEVLWVLGRISPQI